MIRITPDQLDFARRLSRIRREAASTDGPLNWRKYHEFSYEGGERLLFRTSDLEVGMVSSLVMQGTDQPWSCRIARNSFDWVKEFAEGGSYTLNPRCPHSMRLEKHQFGFPLFKIPETTPFPVPSVPLDRLEWTTVGSSRLVRVLEFVAPTGAKCRSERLNTVSLFSTGQCIGHFKGVFLQSTVEAMPFDLRVLRPNAYRLMRWLKLMRSIGQVTEIDAATTIDHGDIPYYIFATQDRQHVIYIVASKLASPPTLSNLVAQDQPAFEAEASATTLRSLGGYFSCLRKARLEFRLRSCNRREWRIDVQAAHDNGVEEVGSFPFEMEPGVPIPAMDSFQLVASDLLTAIDQHGNKKVKIGYFPRTNLLQLSSEKTVRGADDSVQLCSAIRTRRPSTDTEPD